MPVGKLLVIDAEAMQHGRVEVMNVHGLVDNVIAKIIGFTVDNTWLHTTTSHPFGVATGMVVPSVVSFRQAALAIDRSPKFSTPNHQRIVEQTGSDRFASARRNSSRLEILSG